MSLPAEALIHRFLLHVLPQSFQRIRRYGLLANRHKAACLAQARAVLDLPPRKPVPKETVADFARRVLGVDIQCCPVCRSGCVGGYAALRSRRAKNWCEGRMRWMETLPRSRGSPDHV